MHFFICKEINVEDVSYICGKLDKETVFTRIHHDRNKRRSFQVLLPFHAKKNGYLLETI